MGICMRSGFQGLWGRTNARATANLGRGRSFATASRARQDLQFNS
jgi:hypothetical protein